MPDPEETKPVPEQESSSIAEKPVPASHDLGHSPQPGPTGEAVLEVPATATPSQENPSEPAPPKVELKKQATAVAVPHAAMPPTSAVPPESAPASPVREAQPVSAPLKEEVNVNLPAVAMEVEIDFILDRKRIPLAALSTLAVGEMITLSGADFKVTLFLQENAIGEGELVMVDQKPTIQVTKVFNVP